MILTKNKIKKALKDNLKTKFQSCFIIKKIEVIKPKNKNKKALLLNVQEITLRVSVRFL